MHAVELNAIKPDCPDEDHVGKKVNQQITDGRFSEHNRDHRNTQEGDRSSRKTGDEGSGNLLSHPSHFDDCHRHEPVKAHRQKGKPRDLQHADQIFVRKFGCDVVKEKKRQTQIHQPRHQAPTVFGIPPPTRGLKADKRDGKQNKNRFG